MAERSFVAEVEKLRLPAGEVFRGEGILAVTKALRALRTKRASLPPKKHGNIPL